MVVHNLGYSLALGLLLLLVRFRPAMTVARNPRIDEDLLPGKKACLRLNKSMRLPKAISLDAGTSSTQLQRVWQGTAQN